MSPAWNLSSSLSSSLLSTSLCCRACGEGVSAWSCLGEPDKGKLSPTEAGRKVRDKGHSKWLWHKCNFWKNIQIFHIITVTCYIRSWQCTFKQCHKLQLLGIRWDWINEFLKLLKQNWEHSVTYLCWGRSWQVKSPSSELERARLCRTTFSL